MTSAYHRAAQRRRCFRFFEQTVRCCADHFRHEHYLCNHQTCLDRKFIVFMTEQELKQHAAREHGGDMSKAERRQALTIPINFQVPLVLRSSCPPLHALPSSVQAATRLKAKTGHHRQSPDHSEASCPGQQ